MLTISSLQIRQAAYIEFLERGLDGLVVLVKKALKKETVTEEEIKPFYNEEVSLHDKMEELLKKGQRIDQRWLHLYDNGEMLLSDKVRDAWRSKIKDVKA